MCISHSNIDLSFWLLFIFHYDLNRRINCYQKWKSLENIYKHFFIYICILSNIVYTVIHCQQGTAITPGCWLLLFSSLFQLLFLLIQELPGLKRKVWLSRLRSMLLWSMTGGAGAMIIWNFILNCFPLTGGLRENLFPVQQNWSDLDFTTVSRTLMGLEDAMDASTIMVTYNR